MIEQKQYVGYVYLTTNLINNKKYIGKRQQSKFCSNYLGSGQRIKSAIKKYGKENFKVKILQWCSSLDELGSQERYYIHEHNAVNDINYYNIALGGNGAQLPFQREETKQKIGNANRNKRRTQEMNQKNSEVKKGSKWMHKDKVQTLVMRDEVENYLSNGWTLGMYHKNISNVKHSEDTKRKMSGSAKGKSKSREQVNKQIESLKAQKRHWYTDGVTEISLPEGDTIPQNFKRGRIVTDSAIEKNRQAHIGKTPWNKGKKSIK